MRRLPETDFNATPARRTADLGATVTLTAEQVIIRDLDQAWTDLIRARAILDAARWHSWEARTNAFGDQEAALRTIDACREDLDDHRAQLAVTEERVSRLAEAAARIGDPVALAVAYLVFGSAVLALAESAPAASMTATPAYRIAIVRKGQPAERSAATTGGDLRDIVWDLIRAEGGTITDADHAGLIATVGDARSMADIEGFAALKFGAASITIRPA